jgi:hypothetical protein
MTYRERRAARAERLRSWADKRTTDAERVLSSQPELRHDWAFITQPGHIPERARMNRADDRAHASLNKAASMARRADGIDAAAERAIYSDDPDAVERLRERIAELEAERDRITAYNASARKAHKADPAQHVGDLSILDASQRADVVRLASIGFLRPDGAFPGYATSNLSGNISKQRERLARMTGPRPAPTFQPDRRGVCRRCGEPATMHHEPAPGALLLCP